MSIKPKFKPDLEKEALKRRIAFYVLDKYNLSKRLRKKTRYDYWNLKEAPHVSTNTLREDLLTAGYKPELVDELLTNFDYVPEFVVFQEEGRNPIITPSEVVQQHERNFALAEEKAKALFYLLNGYCGGNTRVLARLMIRHLIWHSTGVTRKILIEIITNELRAEAKERQETRKYAVTLAKKQAEEQKG